jgi:hypothetical protein
MSQKEKAKGLVERFVNISPFEYKPKLTEVNIMAVADVEYSKQCAIISLKDKIEYCKTWGDMALDDIKEFEEIIKEIEKL